MYLNIMITIVAVIVVYWFVEGIIVKLTFKTGKHFAKMTGHATDFLDTYSQMQEQFRTGNFDQVISLADKVLAESPYESSALSHKAYALYHQKNYAQAKEAFLLLDSLPNCNCKNTLDRINDKE